LWRGVGGRLLPHPAQAGAPCVCLRREKRVKERLALRGEQRSETLPGLAVGVFAGRGDEAFQAGEARTHNLLAAQLVTSQLEQQCGFVML
jgi:hypothetical protein